MATTYNFRYEAERERFYEDVRKDRLTVLEEHGDEIHSDLRLVFEIGGFSSDQRKKQEKRIRDKDENAFRGLRTFKGLRQFKKFISSDNKGGSGIQWGRKSLRGETMTARLCVYKMRGNRVIGETTFFKYNIVSE